MDDLFFKEQLDLINCYMNGDGETGFPINYEDTRAFIDMVQEIYEENKALKSKILELTEWREIKTAPKDGTWILGLDSGEVWQIYWDGADWCHNDYDNAYYEPTHWLPLPEAPKVEGE